MLKSIFAGIAEAFFGWITGLFKDRSKGKLAVDADEKPELLKTAGGNIADFERAGGVQPGRIGERVKPPAGGF